MTQNLLYSTSVELARAFSQGESTNQLILDFIKKIEVKEVTTNFHLFDIGDSGDYTNEDNNTNIIDLQELYKNCIENLESKRQETYGDLTLEVISPQVSPITKRSKEKHRSGRHNYTIKDFQREKRVRLNEFAKRRKEYLQQSIDPQTMAEFEKETQELYKKYGAPKYHDKDKENEYIAREREKQDNYNKMKTIAQRINRDNKEKTRIFKSKSKIPVYEEPPEKDPPPLDPSLFDFRKKMENEKQAIDKMMRNISEAEVNYSFEVDEVLELLRNPVYHNEDGEEQQDYHMKYALLFQKLEMIEEMASSLEEALQLN